MSSVSISAWQSGVLGIDYRDDSQGNCFFGFGSGCGQNPRYIGMSIIKGATVIDFSPINVMYGSSGTVAFPVSEAQLTNADTVIAKLWNGYPQAGSTVIAETRKSGSDVLAMETTNPIATIGNTVVGDANSILNLPNQLGNVFPLLLLLGVAVVAYNKSK